jgi:hydroxymethylbilane synthase
MKKNKLLIGTRASKLAMIYANRVKNEISKVFSGEIELIKLTTAGDQNQKDRLTEIGGKGLFSKKIEEELINKKIDVAVHALKDMPSEETQGLITNCFLKRNSPEEILITIGNKKFQELKSNSIIGTSSFRREFQLKRIREDLIYKTIRGNVDTRIKKLKDGLYDGILLSSAGMKFLKLDEYITETFETEEIIPSAGQGIIAIQCRENDDEVISILKKINHDQTYKRAHSERNVLKVLEGDCETAVGVHSKIEGDQLTLEAELFSLDGSERYYEKKIVEKSKFREIGEEIGGILKKKSNNSYKK